MRLFALVLVAEASPARLRRVEAAPSVPAKTGYGAEETTGAIAPGDVDIGPVVAKMYDGYGMSYDPDLPQYLQELMQRKNKKNWGDAVRALASCQKHNGQVVKDEKKRALYAVEEEPKQGLYQSKKSWAEQQKADLEAACGCVRGHYWEATYWYQGDLCQYLHSRLKRNWGQFKNEFKICVKSTALSEAASRGAAMDAGAPAADTTEAVRRLYDVNTSSKTAAQQNYDNMLFDCTVGRFPKYTQYYQGDAMEYMQAKLMTTNWNEVARKGAECITELQDDSRRLYGAPEAPSGDDVAKWKQAFVLCVKGKLPYSVNMPTNDKKYTTLESYLETRMLTFNWGDVSRMLGICQNEKLAERETAATRRLAEYQPDADWEARQKASLDEGEACVRSKFPPAAEFPQGNLRDYLRDRCNVGWGTVRQSLDKCKKMPHMLKMAGRGRRLQTAATTPAPAAPTPAPYSANGDAAYDKAMVECVHNQHRPFSQYKQGSMPEYLDKLQTTNWGEVTRKYEECKNFDKEDRARQLYGGVEEQDANTMATYMAGLEKCVLSKLPYSVKMPKTSDKKYGDLNAYLLTKSKRNWGQVAQKIVGCQDAAKAAGKVRAAYKDPEQWKQAQQAEVDEIEGCVRSQFPTGATFDQGELKKYVYDRMRSNWNTWKELMKACMAQPQMKAMEIRRRLYVVEAEPEGATSATEAYDNALFACTVNSDRYAAQYYQGDPMAYQRSQQTTNWGVVKNNFAECRKKDRRLAEASQAEASYMAGMKDCILGMEPYSTKWPSDKRYTTADSYIETLMYSNWRDVEPELMECLLRDGAAAAADGRKLLSWAEKKAAMEKKNAERKALRKQRNAKKAADRKSAGTKASVKRLMDIAARTKLEETSKHIGACVIAKFPPGWNFKFDVVKHARGRIAKNWGAVKKAIPPCVAGLAEGRRLYDVANNIEEVAECVRASFPPYTQYYGDLKMYIDSQKHRYELQ